ncbi:hypothetical protein LYSHEL_26110 [Lysobacter helvus]|uniref:Uncharacterized protein n=3 Tax=Lysobacterales TaxID=135614 RepID=A0ABM7Q8H4_9GAMM|nr:hypothetical protein LYSCAS_26100 [Lysobacter caseinilyticus]BCT96740.1 hypothetical protein LYSHEL_26110 [Lysobacter helvus]
MWAATGNLRPNGRTSMQIVQQPKRTRAWIDTAAAIVFTCMGALLLNASRVAAADAVRRYGRNVDSGALESMAALVYFAPGTILFALAAVALFRRWRGARWLHLLAWGWAALPLLSIAAQWIRSIVVR